MTRQLYQCISLPSGFGNVRYRDIPATSLPAHRNYIGASRTSALDHNSNGKIPNGSIVFLSVMRCQVACALRGVNTCDGIVQGCFREKHKSMVQGARAEAKGKGEIVVTDLSRTSGTSGTSALVPSRRIVPGRSLRSRTKILEPLLAAWGGLEILHVHVTMYGSGCKVHLWRRLDRDLPKTAPRFCCMCPREALGPAAVANNALYQRNNRRHLPTVCKGMQMLTSSIPKAIPVSDGLALENNIRM